MTNKYDVFKQALNDSEIKSAIGTPTNAANTDSTSTTASLFGNIKGVLGQVGLILASVVVLARNITDITLRDDAGTYIYTGYAVAGTATSAASWKIKRLDTVTGNVLFGGGVTTYTQIWDNRTSLTYS